MRFMTRTVAAVWGWPGGRRQLLAALALVALVAQLVIGLPAGSRVRHLIPICTAAGTLWLPTRPDPAPADDHAPGCAHCPVCIGGLASLPAASSPGAPRLPLAVPIEAVVERATPAPAISSGWKPRARAPPGWA